MQDGELGADLAARHDRHQRAFGVGQGFADGVHLRRQQWARAGEGRELGNAVGGGLGPVRSAEGIVDEDVAQRGQFLGQVFAVLFLALVHAAVLQQDDLPGRNGHAIHPVVQEWDVPAQQFTQACGNRRQRVFRLEFTFSGAAQVRGDHHRRARVQRHLDTRHRGPDAGVFGDVASVVLRHIQISTDENALVLGAALDAQVGEADEVHGRVGDGRGRRTGEEGRF